jgi:hypothetical protein
VPKLHWSRFGFSGKVRRPKNLKLMSKFLLLILCLFTFGNALPGVAQPPCRIALVAMQAAKSEEDFYLLNFRQKLGKWQRDLGPSNLARLARNTGSSRTMLNSWLFYSNHLVEKSIRKYAEGYAAELHISIEEFLNAAGLTTLTDPPPELERYTAMVAEITRVELAKGTGIHRDYFYRWENGTRRPQRWEIRAIAMFESELFGRNGDDSVEEWVTKRYWEYGFLPVPRKDLNGIPGLIPSWSVPPNFDALSKVVKAPSSLFSRQAVYAWNGTALEYVSSLTKARVAVAPREISEAFLVSMSRQEAIRWALRQGIPGANVEEALGLTFQSPSFMTWLEWWLDGRDLDVIAQRAGVDVDKFELEKSPDTWGQFSRNEVKRIAEALGSSPEEALMAAGFFPTEQERLNVK